MQKPENLQEFRENLERTRFPPRQDGQPPKSNKPPKNRGMKADRLDAGEVLEKGDMLVSPNGIYRLIFQQDSNFVLYGKAGPMWSSDSAHDYIISVHVMRMERDGRLVIVSEHGLEFWTNGSGRNPKNTSVLIVRNDGNVVITSNEKIVWSTNTAQPSYRDRTQLNSLKNGEFLNKNDCLISQNVRHKLLLYEDGSLMLYNDGVVVWLSNTRVSDAGDIRLELSDNASLNLVANKTKKWSAPIWTVVEKDSELVLTNDGHVDLLSGGNLIWSPTRRDSLYVGESLAIGEALVAGGSRMTFTDAGHLCCKSTFALSTSYYYCEDDIQNAKYLYLDTTGTLCLKTEYGSILSRFFPPRNDANTPKQLDRTTRFTLGPNGLGSLFINGVKLWSFVDLATGDSEERETLQNKLDGGFSIPIGKELISGNGLFKFSFRNEDGMLILTDATEKVLWSAPSDKMANKLVMDYDGDLVACLGFGIVRNTYWSSNTKNKAKDRPVQFVIQNDGNAVVKTKDEVLWQTYTAVIKR